MLNTTSIDLEQARYNAAADTQTYLARHGESLCALIHVLDSDRAFESTCDLYATFGQVFHEPDAMEAALRIIHDMLAEQAPSAIDEIARKRGMPVAELTRWHGARISELLSRFRHAR